MLLEILATSAVSGVINAFGESSARDEQNKKIKQAIAMLDELKYTDREKNQRMDALSDVWNTNILQTLNESSVGIALSGASNPEVVKTGLTSQMLGKKENTLLQALEQMDAENRNLDMKITELELSKIEGSPITDFTTGAVGGAGVGLQIANFLETQKLNKQYFGNMDKLFPIDGIGMEEALVPVTNKLKDIDNQFRQIKEKQENPWE